MLHDHRLETGVVRYLLTHPAAARRCTDLRPEDLTSLDRGRILWAIQQIAETGERVSIDGVIEALQKRGHATAPTDVRRVMSEGMELAGVNDAIPVLRDLATRRRIQEPLMQLAAMAEDGDISKVRASLRALAAREDEADEAEEGANTYDTKAMLTATVEHWQAEETRPIVDLGALRCMAREFSEGSLTVVGGRSNAGKSQLAFLFAHRWAVATGGRVGIISLEDRAHVWGDRAIANACAVSLLSGRSEDGEDAVRVTKDEMDAMMREIGAMSERNAYQLEVLDRNDITDVERAMLRCLRAGCGMLVVDYVQEIEDATMKGGGRDDLMVASNTRRIKGVGKRGKVPVILPSQIVKPQNGKAEPGSNDLNGSSAIKNMSEAVIMLWKDDDSDQHTMGKVVKLKNGPERPRVMLKRNAGGMINDIMRVENKRKEDAFSDAPGWGVR